MKIHAEKDQLRCRICGSGRPKMICEKKGAVYVLCSSCGVIRQRPYPRKREILEYYRQYRKRKRTETPLYLSDKYWEEFKKIKDLTFKDIEFPLEGLKGKRLLDVGCAVGQFLRYVKKYSVISSGIDVSEDLVAVARQRGFDCSLTPLFDIRRKYDLITMWHVIEHLEYPREYVRHIYGILKKGGNFILELPCTGIISNAFGKDWRFYLPVEHIHLFSQQSLFDLLREEGFKVINWVRFGSGQDGGTVPALNKRVFDTISKRLEIGDTIAVWCKKA